MQLCEKGHKEICYEGDWKYGCPLCESIDIQKNLQNTIDNQTDKIEELTEQLDKSIKALIELNKTKE